MRIKQRKTKSTICELDNIFLFLQIDNLLNSLTQFTQSMQTVLKYNNAIFCTNVMATMENFVVLKKINYTYIAPSQNKSVLLDLFIVINLSKYKKASYSSFYEDEQFLNSSFSTYFTFLPTLLHLSLTLLI